MAYKEVSRLDVMEVIRRWQQGNSQRHIAAGTGLSRDTIRKYLAAAVESGVQREGAEPHRGATEPVGGPESEGSAADSGPRRGITGVLGRPDLPEDHR